MMPSISRHARRLPIAVLAIAFAALVACGDDNDDAPAAPPAAATPVDVRLIAFNDFHGHLSPDTTGSLSLPAPSGTGTVSVRTGGAAFLATKLDELRADRPNTFVISTGDAIGGTPLVSALFRDEPAIEAMNLMGVDVNVVGNHEFDKGRAELERMIRGGCAPANDPNLSTCARPGANYAGARFPFLAANVVDNATNRPILEPYLIREFGGVRMAFIGVVTRTTPTIVVPTGVAGLTFADEAQTINRYVTELKAQGVEAIAVVMHEGGQTDSTLNDRTCANARGPAFDIVDQLDAEVDVVFTGHTHQAYNCVRRGIPVIQGSAFGRLVSVVDLKLDPATRDVVPGSATATNEPVVNGANTVAGFQALAARADVAALVQEYTALSATRANRQIGSISAPFTRTAGSGGDHSAGRLIADAQLAATQPAGFGNAQVAFMNPGGVRADFTAAGPVTFGQAFTVQPFGNSLVTMTLTGNQIDTLLEQQFSGGNATSPRILQPSEGFTYTWDFAAPAGARVDIASIRINGTPIVPTQAYRITVNSFLAEGGDNFAILREGTNRLGGALDIDALIAYLQARSPVAPVTAGRITRLN